MHFEATVVAEAFRGKLPLARNRMVYATLGERMGGEIHRAGPEDAHAGRSRSLIGHGRHQSTPPAIVPRPSSRSFVASPTAFPIEFHAKDVVEGGSR